MKRAIAEAEVDWTAIRAQCAGGQNVNKFSSAVHLRFDVAASFFKRPTRTRDFVAQILQAPAPFFHRTAWSLRPMASGARRPG